MLREVSDLSSHSQFSLLPKWVSVCFVFSFLSVALNCVLALAGGFMGDLEMWRGGAAWEWEEDGSLLCVGMNLGWFLLLCGYCECVDWKGGSTTVWRIWDCCGAELVRI